MTDAATEFPPHVLREYALLADGERGALIGPRGDVAWMCVPRWDSDAVFASLIGGRGVYAVQPTGRFVWGGHYEEGTLIWRSRWITETGIIECREALAFPGDRERVVVLRRILAVDGDAKVRVVLDACAGFGEHRLRSFSLDEGTWTSRTGAVHARLTGGAQLEPGGTGHARHVLAGELAVPAGAHHDLVLELSEQPLPDDAPLDPSHAWEATEHAWRDAVPALPNNIARHDARHAYAVLRGLTISGGGMVAAATTGLPERARRGRNYDYRYMWIRDQCFAGQAVAADGPHPLLDDAVRVVSDRLLADGDQMAPAYTTSGDPVPEQRTLGLPGYPGGTDVVGNRVHAQFQLDGFGEALLLLAAAAGHDHLDADGWRAAETAADAISHRWREPEAGVWELEDAKWTESRLICAAGLRAISGAGAPASRTAEWLALADKLLAETAATSTSPSGWWQRRPGDDRVDAALLFPVIRGAVPAHDPRASATVEAVAARLSDQHYLYRFRHGPGPLGSSEGAFLLCGFAMAIALHRQGHSTEAARWFERNRAACGPSGLFSEEYDVAERQLRGNLPQAFVHALMFEAAANLSGA